MKIALWMVVGAVVLPSVAQADFFSVNAKSTYLRTAATDTPANPKIIDLSALTFPVNGGDFLLLERIGAVVFATGGTDVGTETGCVFSSTNTLLDPSNINRVPGALDAGIDFTSPVTSVGSLSTDITQDFRVDDAQGGLNRHFSSVVVQVPVGAQYLFVGIVDNRYSDNSDPNGDYGLSITPIPEPGALAILGLGVAPFLCRRSRRVKLV